MTKAEKAIDTLANRVMMAVIQSGCIRDAHEDADIDVAIKVMREELKLFLFDPKYGNERALIMNGTINHLGTATLVTECVKRITQERQQ